MFGTLRCRSRSDPDARAPVVPSLTRVQEAPPAGLGRAPGHVEWVQGSRSPSPHVLSGCRKVHLAVPRGAKDPRGGLKWSSAELGPGHGPRDLLLLLLTSHSGRRE